MKLISKASLQIQKSREEVFEAIVNPELMTKYFISESTGKLETGSEVYWKFPEFKDSYLVKEVKVIPNALISFVWDPETVVTIRLEKYREHDTIVSVEENGKEINEANLDWVISNTGGWANFLASMKAYLEYSISLRKGAYQFMSKQ